MSYGGEVPYKAGQPFWHGKCTIICAIENDKWHLSIAHPTRYPTWDEIKDARYEFIPNNVTVALLLPPKEEYVNLHKNCFHLHEIEGPKELIIP